MGGTALTFIDFLAGIFAGALASAHSTPLAKFILTSFPTVIFDLGLVWCGYLQKKFDRPKLVAAQIF